METPLYTALARHRALGRASFHTPGHKGNLSALPGDLLSLDLTELPDTDSLFEASGAILEAERLAARAFGAERTLFSAGGCSLCIQAMLRLAAPLGGKIACARNVHRTAINAMALLGLEPIWAMPENLEACIESTPHIKAAYVTSPDYYGRLADIPALAAACKRWKIPLLVDNAHGAHLAFLTPSLHPLHLGASMTACSAHKTLNVLTGGAWLNLSTEAKLARVDISGAKDAMALFGSTSPSYPIMASLDLCRAWLEEEGRAAFAALTRRIAPLEALALKKNLLLNSPRRDPTRLVLNTAALNMSGPEAGDYFRARGVEPELADGIGVVFICTPFNSASDFERLEAALDTLPQGKPLPPASPLPPIPPQACSPREAVLSPNEKIPLKDAVGRVAAQAVCPCPPGVPVVMPGERITKESREFLDGYGFFTIKVLK